MIQFNEFLSYYLWSGLRKKRFDRGLRERGYVCIEEAGRQIIQDQPRVGGDALPWANIVRFKELMFEHALKTYEEAKGIKGPVFFDRGVVDLIGYDAQSTENLLLVAKKLRYNSVAPPWEAIYCNNAERKQTFEEAVATNLDEGYRIIELPLKIAEERIEFIINSID